MCNNTPGTELFGHKNGSFIYFKSNVYDANYIVIKFRVICDDKGVGKYITGCRHTYFI